MAALSVNAGVTGMSRAAETPRGEWDEILYLRRRLCERVLPNDCRALLFFIEDGRASGDFMGFGSEERYLRDGLGIDDTDAATWAVRGLQLLNQDVPVSFAQAVTLGRRGRPKKGDEKVGNAKFNGSTQAYNVARLERDDPELAQAVRRGEISAHAAAVQAGIRKPTWTAPADPERLAQAIEKRFPGWRLVRA